MRDEICDGLGRAEALVLYAVTDPERLSLPTKLARDQWVRSSQRTIARVTGLSQPTVSRAVAKLTQAGLLRRHEQPGSQAFLRLA